MENRFRFRVPFFDNQGKFINFVYCDMLKGISPYNAGICHKGDIQLNTGLKDKNGKLIYEGDIVKVDGYGVKGVYEIEWNEITACFCIACYESDCFEHSQSVMEVIGNIYENKELLNGR